MLTEATTSISQLSSEYPLLEPLSQATDTVLKELQLYPNEFLEIDTDETGTDFIMEPVSYEKTSDDVFTVEINGVRYKKTQWQVSRRCSQFFDRLPEIKVLTDGKRWCAGTDFTVLVTRHAWTDKRIVFLTEEAKLLFWFLVKRFMAQTKCAKIIADFKLHKIVPENIPHFVDHPDLPLSPAQKTGLAASLIGPTWAHFMYPGTGKTATTVARVMTEARAKKAGQLAGSKPGLYRVLVVCPSQVRLNWEREFERFATEPGKTSVLRGGPVQRVKFLIDGIRQESGLSWGACILSMDSAEGIMEALRKVPWDLIVVDESHGIKWHGTNRFKTMNQFNDCDVRAKMILTGTPIANTVFDLWSQYEFLSPGLSGFKKFSAFRKFHGQFKQLPGTSVQKLIGLTGLPLIQERLARTAYILTKEEAGLDLPDKLYEIAEVEMTPKQAEFYKKLNKELVAEIDDLIDSQEGKVSVDLILTKLLRLAQVTSGHCKTDESFNEEDGTSIAGKVFQIDKVNPKVEAIIARIIEEQELDPNGKAIIWCTFVEDIRIMSATLAARGIKHVGYHDVIADGYRVRSAREAEQMMNLVQECKVLVANPASAGEGLNVLGYDRENPDSLPTFVNQEHFFSCNWSMLHRTQAEDRAHRRGSRSSVKIIDWVVAGTIDEEIRARVLAKKQKAMLIQDVREILKKISDMETRI